MHACQFGVELKNYLQFQLTLPLRFSSNSADNFAASCAQKNGDFHRCMRISNSKLKIQWKVRKVMNHSVKKMETAQASKLRPRFFAEIFCLCVRWDCQGCHNNVSQSSDANISPKRKSSPVNVSQRSETFSLNIGFVCNETI